MVSNKILENFQSIQILASFRVNWLQSSDKSPYYQPLHLCPQYLSQILKTPPFLIDSQIRSHASLLLQVFLKTLDQEEIELFVAENKFFSCSSSCTAVFKKKILLVFFNSSQLSYPPDELIVQTQF